MNRLCLKERLFDDVDDVDSVEKMAKYVIDGCLRQGDTSSAKEVFTGYKDFKVKKRESKTDFRKKKLELKAKKKA